jgi:hypothetical protein
LEVVPSAVAVETDLLLITAEECTTQYKAFAQQDEYTAGCFAEADSADDFKCTAIVVTGKGEYNSELESYSRGRKGHLDPS